MGRRRGRAPQLDANSYLQYFDQTSVIIRFQFHCEIAAEKSFNLYNNIQNVCPTVYSNVTYTNF